MSVFTAVRMNLSICTRRPSWSSASFPRSGGHEMAGTPSYDAITEIIRKLNRLGCARITLGRHEFRYTNNPENGNERVCRFCDEQRAYGPRLADR